MRTISDYELKQMWLKLNIIKNSNESAVKEIDVLEEEPEVKSLIQYVNDLQLGKIKFEAKDEKTGNEILDELVKTKIVFPNGAEGEVYENKEVSENRKKEGYKNKLKDEPKDLESQKNLAKYLIVSLKDEEGKPYELIVDENGFDIGKIIYDEKGKPSFEISPELKEKIDERLLKANVRSQVEERTIQEEFYLKNIDCLIEALEKGIVVPENEKTAGERAIAAARIVDAKRSHIGYYPEMEEDASKALTKTTQELEEKKLEEEAEALLRQEKGERNTVLERERDITEEREEDLEEEEYTRNIETQPKLIKTDKDRDDDTQEKDKEENEALENDKKEEILDMCDKNNLDSSKIEAVFIIKDPANIADFTEDMGLNRKGNEITVLQFSSASGKEQYALIQDGVMLEGEQYHEPIRRMVAHLKMSYGVVDKVDDTETKIDYSVGNQVREIQVQGFPKELSIEQKEELIKCVDELQTAKAYGLEDLETREKLRDKLYKTFVEAGFGKEGEEIIEADIADVEEAGVIEANNEDGERSLDDEEAEMAYRRNIRYGNNDAD